METILQSTDKMRSLVHHLRPFTEVEITSGRVEDLLTNSWTWEDLYAQFMFKEVKLLWTTERSFLCNAEYGVVPSTDDRSFFGVPSIPDRHFFVDPYRKWKIRISSKNEGDKSFSKFLYLYAPSGEQAATTLNILMKLLSRSRLLKEIRIQNSRSFTGTLPTVLPISLEALQKFVGSTHKSRRLMFLDLTFDENQSHALFSAVSENVHLAFSRCMLKDEGSSLLEAIQAKQGPVGLTFESRLPSRCVPVLEAVRGTTHLKSLRLGYCKLYDRQIRVLASSLAENRGLRELAMVGIDCFSSQYWTLLCHSLSNHPVLEKFEVRTLPSQAFQEVKTARTQPIVDMLKTNTVLKEIKLTRSNHDEQMIRDEIEPRLEENAFPLRVQALAQESDTDLRLHLFGKTLEKVKDKPSLIYMLVVANHDLLRTSYPISNNM